MMMKRQASLSFSIIATLGVAACTAPGLDGFTSYDAPPEPSSATASTGSTSLASTPTTSGGGSPASTTGEVGSTSAEDGSSSTSGAPEPLGPPLIVGHALSPDPLAHSGAIIAMIATANADGVHMQVDGDAPVALSLAEPDAFAGEIAFLSATIDNGDHAATFVATRDALESDPLTIPFTVTLPPSGSEVWWDSDIAIDKGSVAALAVTADGELLELGTYYPMGQARCYLRRRDLGGAWFPHDFLDIMPDTACSPIDLAVDADGAIHVLADKWVDGEQHWWLGTSDAWGAPFANRGAGGAGETAHALASAPPRVAVCGTRPIKGSPDATAWIFTANQAAKILSFDYVPEGKDNHSIHETPADCAFSSTYLVLAGGAWGKHDIDDKERERHFILEIDVATEEHQWTVAKPDLKSQSAALTLAIDPQGRYITGGQACDDACTDPVGELRMFQLGEPQALQLWHRPLEPGVGAPRGIAWSPANYIVFVGARAQGPNDTTFLVQSYVALHAVPFWSYDHHDGPDFQYATTLALGPYGQIYAGGVRAGGFPALAFVAP